MKRDTLFGIDKGYEGEATIADAFKESKMNGIFITNFSSKDQNNILQSKSKVTFECDFILLTQDCGIWAVEVCNSSKTRIHKSIKEKLEQLIKNRTYILTLAEKLYGQDFSSELAKICHGIVAVPSATSDDLESFKKTAPWQSYISSNPCFVIEFIGEERVTEPLSIADCIRGKKQLVLSTIFDHLFQFYATITLVKTHYRTLDLETIISKKEKRDIYASTGMSVNEYHVILSPEQLSILKEAPTHLHIIGEAATGKTEMLKAVSHMILQYKFGEPHLHSANISNLADGVNTILYIIFGDKSYLKESIEDYFYCFNQVQDHLESKELSFQVHSIAGISVEEICDNMLEILKSVAEIYKTFILVDECYHRIENQEVLKYLVSSRGCWIANVLTGQQPFFNVLHSGTGGYKFSVRALRRVYRGTHGITVASSTLKLSSTYDLPAYLANRFSYIRSCSDVEVNDIEQITDLLKNEGRSLHIVLKGQDDLREFSNYSATFSRKKENLTSQKSIYRNENYYEETNLQEDKIDDQIVYQAKYSGAEWNTVNVVLDLSLKEFHAKADIMYLLLSICSSRSLCKCRIICHHDFWEMLNKRLFPSSVIEAVRSGNSLDVRKLRDYNATNEFLSISQFTPITVAAGACNLDIIENILKRDENELGLSIHEVMKILIFLTEPFPDERMFHVTETVLRKSRPFFMVAEFPLLQRVCLLQSENEWHFKIFMSLINFFSAYKSILRDVLISAASGNHKQCAKYLIKAIGNVNMQDNYGFTALMAAVQSGHMDTVAQSGHTDIVEMKADVDKQNKKDGFTSLRMAAKKGYLDIVKYLIEADADVNLQDKKGDLALIMAANQGHIDTVRYLIEANASVNMQNEEGATALLLAAQNGHMDIVKCLIQLNSNVNMQSKDGYTALIVAAQKGNMDIVRYLIEANAKVDMQTENGLTALQRACQYGHLGAAEHLIKANADVDLKDEDGLTPLRLASQYKHAHIVRLLIDTNCDVNAQDEDGDTALMLASSHGHINIVRYLIEANTDSDMQNEDGFTAIMKAACWGHTDIVRYLTEANADINMQDKDGNTALMFAAGKGHSKIVRYLTEAKADVNIRNERGLTALMLATVFGHMDNVKYIAEGSADVRLQINEDFYALSLAVKNGHMDIVRYLLRLARRGSM